MTRLALDTSAYSHFKVGHEPVVALIDSADWLGVPVVVLGELRSGFELGKRRDQNERDLARFLQNPVVHVLDVDDAASSIYADIVVALRTAGTPVPTNDVWIAAVSAREGATVLTYDAHFRNIGRVGSQVLSKS